MNTLIRGASALALVFATASALAGEIAQTTINVSKVENLTNSSYTFAWQDIGVATGNGRILNSTIDASNARNHGASRTGYSVQYIGGAFGGTMDNVRVYARNVFNQSTADSAKATQEIGIVRNNGRMRDVTILADGAVNRATVDQSDARQRLGVAE